jgi:hypothetical protein
MTSQQVKRTGALCSLLPLVSALSVMLVKEDFVDLAVPNQSNKLRVYFYEPNLPEYPYAKFPGNR